MPRLQRSPIVVVHGDIRIFVNDAAALPGVLAAVSGQMTGVASSASAGRTSSTGSIASSSWQASTCAKVPPSVVDSDDGPEHYQLNDFYGTADISSQTDKKESKEVCCGSDLRLFPIYNPPTIVDSDTQTDSRGPPVGVECQSDMSFEDITMLERCVSAAADKFRMFLPISDKIVQFGIDADFIARLVDDHFSKKVLPDASDGSPQDAGSSPVGVLEASDSDSVVVSNNRKKKNGKKKGS
eukprot:TRINITY_DN26920_c0_g1_i1.p1 TRINITY_DN26920_c0_g1~~TRINITY_DN26920_c0_g1_i1.p1  ORF type:complete len:240 (+),score=58.06 TRINITY_DN26920_c0_g1_i1:71-790(+)